jgi:hypothetical protein
MWRNALGHALAISSSLLALFYYWFAVADRYAIFLYNHLGATPFDERTRSRYWMSGLVASGALLLGYTLFNWYAGRFAGLRYRTYEPPSWWQVWLLSVVALSIGIPLITMRVNQPTLPWPLAFGCVVAALCGLALALLPGKWAARQPLRLLLLALAGLGLVPSLLLLRAVELPTLGLVSHSVAYIVAAGGTVLGAIWLVGMTFVQLRWFKHRFSTLALLIAGFCWSYLLLPLAHYLLFTPPAFRYISVADNFFAQTLWAQSLSIFTALGLATSASWLGFHWSLAWGEKVAEPPCAFPLAFRYNNDFAMRCNTLGAIWHCVCQDASATVGPDRSLCRSRPSRW